MLRNSVYFWDLQLYPINCIPSIVSHTLLHTLPKVGFIPKNSERRSMVIYGHAQILRESLIELRER
jgi:hypothetical protein